MRHKDLQHVVAAAARIVGEEEWVVIGSQSILGTYPDAPPDLLHSMEADLYPRQAPDKADVIEGVLGDGSRYHEAFGYYAHAVGPRAAQTKRRIAWHDLGNDTPDSHRGLVRTGGNAAAESDGRERRGTVMVRPSTSPASRPRFANDLKSRYVGLERPVGRIGTRVGRKALNTSLVQQVGSVRRMAG